MPEVSEKFVITLRMNNQSYPVTVLRAEEEIYRTAERRINEKLNLYKTRFPQLGDERYMFMTMLDFMVRLIRSEQRNDTQPFSEAYEQLTAEIEEALKK